MVAFSIGGHRKVVGQWYDGSLFLLHNGIPDGPRLLAVEAAQLIKVGVGEPLRFPTPGMASGGRVAWLRIRGDANEIPTSLMLACIT
jgi:hypothetical protein